MFYTSQISDDIAKTTVGAHALLLTVEQMDESQNAFESA